MRRILIMTAGLLTIAASSAAGLLTPLSRTGIERALALARWPSTDEDRARFHARYIAHFPPGGMDPIAVESIEVVTEFRRMELIAEAHARLDDLFARGGAIQEAEQALAPYRGRVSIVAHLRLGPFPAGMPDVAVAFDTGINSHAIPPEPLTRSSTPIYSEGAITGIDAESVFRAASIGQRAWTVIVHVDRKPVARATFDFGAID